MDEQSADIQSADARAEQVGRSTAMMSMLVIVSRLTGFVRTWAQAYALGITVAASCYAVANNLPNQLYEIVVGGMLVTAFLPVYLSEKERAGREACSRYTSNLTSIVLLLMGILTILCIVFAAQVVYTQSFSANEDFDAALAQYFFRFFAIEIVLYSLSSIFSGVLNAERDYFWSSAAPIFNNFVTIASFLLYAKLADSNPQLALLILALGNPLGVLVQVLIQMPALSKLGIKLNWHIDFSDPALKDTLAIGIPSLVVMLCSFETTSVMTSSALSVTASGASISAYSRLWFTLPYAIFVVPITTAMFTELSHDYAAGNMDAYKKGVSSGISQIVFTMIPFALYLIVFSVPLITILAAGRFSAEDIGLTAAYLAALSVSLPVYGVCMYLQKVCSSIRRMQIFTIASIVAAVLQTLICLLLTPVFGINVVALSSAVYMLAVDVVTLVFLRQELGAFGMREVLSAAIRASILALLGSAVGALVAFVVLPRLGVGTSSSVLSAFIQVLCGGLPAVLVTFGIAVAAGMDEVGVITRLLGRMTGRRAQGRG